MKNFGCDIKEAFTPLTRIARLSKNGLKFIQKLSVAGLLNIGIIRLDTK